MGSERAAFCVLLIAGANLANLQLPEAPSLDWRILSVAAALLVTNGAGIGVAPAFWVCRRAQLAGLQEGPRAGGRRERLRSTLVAAEVAAYISFLPMETRGGIWPVSVRGRVRVSGAVETASLRYVTPAFFQAMGIPFHFGRDLSESDTIEQPFVAVVSESFVRHYWPNDNPIGRHFQFGLQRPDGGGRGG